MRLSDVVSPLIVEPDGEIVPIRYGFHRNFSLGNLDRARLRDLEWDWRAAHSEDFPGLCREVFARMSADDAPTFDNWYERLADAADAARA